MIASRATNSGVILRPWLFHPTQAGRDHFIRANNVKSREKLEKFVKLRDGDVKTLLGLKQEVDWLKESSTLASLLNPQVIVIKGKHKYLNTQLLWKLIDPSKRSTKNEARRLMLKNAGFHLRAGESFYDGKAMFSAIVGRLAAEDSGAYEGKYGGATESVLGAMSSLSTIAPHPEVKQVFQDHPGVDFSGLDLREMNLGGLSFIQAILNMADLTGANLEGLNLSCAKIFGTTFYQANLRKANLNSVEGETPIFSQANLTGASLRNASIEGRGDTVAATILTDASGANFTDADLSDAHLNRMRVDGASLTRADVSGTYLIGTALSRAYLKDTNLSSAVLDKDEYDSIRELPPGSCIGEPADHWNFAYRRPRAADGRILKEWLNPSFSNKFPFIRVNKVRHISNLEQRVELREGQIGDLLGLSSIPTWLAERRVGRLARLFSKTEPVIVMEKGKRYINIAALRLALEDSQKQAALKSAGFKLRIGDLPSDQNFFNAIVGRLARPDSDIYESKYGQLTTEVLAVLTELSPSQELSPEHKGTLAKLDHERQGVDLSGLDLRSFILAGLNLSRAQLDKARFDRAELSGADLSYASLNRTNFSGGDLTGANLSFAVGESPLFFQTTLVAADFSGSNMPEANFKEANLQGTLF